MYCLTTTTWQLTGDVGGVADRCQAVGGASPSSPYSQGHLAGAFPPVEERRKFPLIHGPLAPMTPREVLDLRFHSTKEVLWLMYR